MSSDILKKVREYEKRCEKFISNEQRPSFHLSSYIGWMNDPNGFSVYQGKYHLFYQYHPYSLQWGSMHWGHAVSEDLLHWEYLPAALVPDQDYDAAGCFSGSAIELPDGKQLLIYTGVQKRQQEDGSELDFQTQCVALGDGVDYVKLETNPVLTGKDIPKGFSPQDFRDPKIWREKDGTYFCVVGNRTNDNSGSILLFQSKEGLEWEFVTILERCYNEYGLMWECPDFFPLKENYVLLTSAQDMSAVGLEFHNGNCSMGIIGTYDMKTHIFLRNSVQALDYGIDFYAAQTLLSPDGRRIMIAWMQNWDTISNKNGTLHWFGQMTIPRELTLQNGRLLQTPIRELESIRGKRTVYKNIPLHEEESLNGIYGRVLDMTVTIKPIGANGYHMFRMKVAKGSRHYTSITFYPKLSKLNLNRSHSGCNRDIVHERECFVRNRDGELKLRIIMDKFSIEIFVNDGEQVMSACIYTPETADGISFETEGNALLDVEKYDLLTT